ncbi:hypothetical protein CBR_g27920 [Chara braunii]|uniref:DUF659 domain-containing protein n=1 Tax=Chara braunii TaxID=69332 RepID=A0A388L8T2_CHABU|nr:hypothetical protein CBR_g27920 [Chara braunii]|eukprot:GBG78694.1 hypothetical protein CBR_g27920 [Chara braunii]
MASGSKAGCADGGEGSQRQSERGGGRGKDIASSSATSLGVVDKVPTPATDPSLFVPQPEAKQTKLQGEKEVWKHVEQGQEAAPKGAGRVLAAVFTTFRRGGAAVNEDDDSAVVPRGYEEPQPPVAAGREPVEEPVQRGKETAAAQAAGEDGASTTRMVSMQQTAIKRWVDNAGQKKLDVAWAEAMFRDGIAFQFLEFDTTQQLHNVYLEVTNARPQVKLPSSKHIRTVMLEFIFMRIQKQVEPLTKCWDVTGCTFITDGSNDRRERPVMNFLASGEQGAVLVAAVYMDGKKKTGAALAKLWEKIMREIGLQRINAICTDNAEGCLVEGANQGGGDDGAVVSPTAEDGQGRDCTVKPCGVRPTHGEDAGGGCADTEAMKFCAREDGGDVPKLQAISIKVMGMWSTATPAEHNWSSMDLMHSKRRNQLKPATVEKLVYINWNMNLLRASKNLKDHHYVDLWAEFFESLPDAEAGDDPLLEMPEEETEKTKEEQAKERALTKLPKGWIPKNLEEDEEELTDDSDLEDEIWKGKAPWSETSSEGEAEDGSDDDFELGAVPSIPGTTYVGRRRTTGCHRECPPTTPCQGTANTSAHYDIQSDVELPQTDTDINMVLRPGPIDADEAEADRAKAMADADRERVQRRMREEERRAAVPTRREMETQKNKVGEHEPKLVREMGQQEEEEEEEMGQQDEEEGHEMAHHVQEEEEMEEEEEEACMEQREEEMEQDEGKCTDQQDEGLEDQHAERVGESEEEQQHDEMANSKEEAQQQQHAPTTVYKRRKKTAQPAGSPENSPEFPNNIEGSQHDNLWVSRVGRKRKTAPVDDVPRLKLPLGRPRKNKTAREIVTKLVANGVNVVQGDKNTHYLLKNNRQQYGIVERGEVEMKTEEVDEEVPGYKEPQPPATAGRAAGNINVGTERVDTVVARVGEGSGSNT